MSVHEQVDQLLAGFALGAASDEEAALVRRHLPDCDACTQALAYMTEVVGALPLTVDEVTPPAGMRDRVLAAARGNRQSIPMSAPITDARPGPAPRRRLPVTSWRFGFAAAAVFLLVLTGWNLSLQNQLNHANSQLAQVQTNLNGTLVAAQGAAAGTIKYLPRDHVALVSLHALASPPGGKVYELWVINSAGKAEPAGVFLPEADGDKTLVVARTLSSSDKLAVTVEPLGGSLQPTSTPIITGSI